jgi:hypothetical protein
MKKLLIAMASVVLLSCLAVALYVRWALADPDVVIPNPKMPSPNAYDTYVAAGNLIVDGDEIENAAQGKRGQGGAKEYSIAEKAALVEKNTAALAKLREGVAFTYMEPPARSTSHTFPHYAKYRQMARLLRLQGDVLAARGDYAGAAESNLNGYEFAVKIANGGAIIGMLVSVSCQRTSLDGLSDCVSGLDAEHAALAARRVLSAGEKMTVLSEVLRNEKWFTQAYLLEWFRHPEKLVEDTSEETSDESGERAAQMMLKGALIVYGKRRIIENVADYYDALIADADVRYARRSQPPRIPSDVISRMILPVLGGVRCQYVKGQARSAIAAVALALHAYREDHGAYPDGLSGLVPGYVPSLPDDPFAMSGPLRYRVENDGYVLYSLGPDCKDDDGRPIGGYPSDKDTEEIRKLRTSFKEDAKGDIVAGVNTT